MDAKLYQLQLHLANNSNVEYIEHQLDVGLEVSQDTFEYLQDAFVFNVLLGEMTDCPSNVYGCTVDIQSLVDCDCSRQKLTNIRNILDVVHSHSGPLTVDLVNKVHRLVAQGLFETGYRTRNVAASGCGLVYLPHQAVESRLRRLVDFVNAQYDDGMRVVDAIALGTLFFSEFLLIHPFVNGNGRAARVLLNCFLKPFVKVVPVTLGDPSKSLSEQRKEYMCALNARNDRVSAPTALVDLVVDSIARTIADVGYLET